MPREPVLDPGGLARALERLSSLIPGYNGYRSQQSPQEEDRALRDVLARHLAMIVGRGERALRLSGSTLRTEESTEARKCLEVLNRSRDRVRFAPAGRRSVLAGTLTDQDRHDLVALDAGVWAVVGELETLTGEWDLAARSGEPGWPGERLVDALFELDEALEERETYLRR